MSDTKTWSAEDWEVYRRTRQEALAKVKVGDKVTYGRRQFLTVERLTDKQIIVRKMRFHRETGRQIGGGSSISAHPEDIAKVKAVIEEEQREEAKRKARHAAEAADTHLQAAKRLMDLVLLQGGFAPAVKEAYSEKQLLAAIAALEEKVK